MRRRTFLATLGCTALMGVPIANAQQKQARVWRVGYLTPATKRVAEPYLQAFIQGMRELGYLEGQNLALIARFADLNYERLPSLGRELVAEHPDLIVAALTPAVVAAQRATSTIPIVMVAVADPLGSGFIKTLARPGGNITGMSFMSVDLTAKALERLRAIVPSAARIAVLMSANPVHRHQYDEANIAARAIGTILIPVTVNKPDELERAFATMTQEKCDALVVLADTIRVEIVDLANKARLPTIYQLSQLVRAGGLISYGTAVPPLFRRAAYYVDKILRGTAPGELPVEQPTKFELVINLKTAKALGLEIPSSLIAIADEVIER